MHDAVAPPPRVLLISQWPKIKNGEYELIEKIKQTGWKAAVVDYFGFDVETGECVNRADLGDHFDFAISFHYDTPKFLNLPTFLWVANPLEFMHLRGDYRGVLLHHLRAYDGYLYNGSDTLKTHIRNVVGSEWRDSALAMYPSCSQKALVSPKAADAMGAEKARKVFYCGVNWERGVDRKGRAQGLLDILQDRDAADFYGPSKLEGISPWEGFKSYRGEIPFDGVSMAQVMRDYGAVLAVSSPAHMKSRTSSSRVFEGFAAGVPVISDENPHVQQLFGDLVYYFCGETEAERAQSILGILERINACPGEARERVLAAQRLMHEKLCFEPCFSAVRATLERPSLPAEQPVGRQLDVFVFHHDPDRESTAPSNESVWGNLVHIVRAAGQVAACNGVHVRIVCCADEISAAPEGLPLGVSWQPLLLAEVAPRWERLRLGEKVALLASRVTGQHASFLTQFDFPHSDHFRRALDWFDTQAGNADGAVHVGGFFVNDLGQNAPLGTVGIVRNNTSLGMYRWTQNSLAEHQFSVLVFRGAALDLLAPERIGRFDVVLPISIIAEAQGRCMPLHRSRHITMRVERGSFHRHYEVYRKATERGFWAQHYEMVSNYNHELNALYDVHHESGVAREIADLVSGHALPPVPPVDPAVHAVNQMIGRIRPIYRRMKKARDVILFRGGRA